MNFNGITLEKLVLIAVIAGIIIGPEKLPGYAEKLAQMVRKGGEMLKGARSRMREEIGAEADDLDWRKLDPRQYDPRRIIRDALLDDSPPPRPSGQSAIVEPAKPAVPSVLGREFSRETPPPFDVEAT